MKNDVLLGRKLKVVPKQVGEDWEPNLETDVLADNIDESHWFGECEWLVAPIGENRLNRLTEKATRVLINLMEAKFKIHAVFCK